MSVSQIAQFTKTLLYYTKAHVSLHSALLYICGLKGIDVHVKNACRELSEYLEQGSSFSLALKKCREINFDEAYIAFISAAEESGNIIPSLEFLSSRNEQIVNSRKKIFSACMYPAFILCTCIALCIVMFVYCADIAPSVGGTFDAVSYRNEALSGTVGANVFLAISTCALVLAVKYIFSGHDGEALCRVLVHLMRGNVDFYRALGISMMVAKKNPRLRAAVLLAMESLEQGMPLSRSLMFLGAEYEVPVQLCQSSGNVAESLEQVLQSLEQKRLVREKFFISMLEPAMLLVVAVYLAILIKCVFIPVIFNYGI